MKQVYSLLTAIILLFSFGTSVLATSDTSVSDVLGSQDTQSTTTENNATTTDNSLSLTIATQTDNPSSVITFIDPSTDKKGVQLEIDSKGFTDITSPYTFPALAIGKHTLEFKYVDENGATQVYDTNIIIVPRVPILNSPSITADSISISGTGLANAEIMVLISNGANVVSKNGTIDGEGNWAFNITRESLPDSVYSISAYVRRYGYASNLSEVTKFTIGENTATVSSDNNKFDLTNLSFNNIKTFIVNNQLYIYLSILFLIIGMFIGLIINKEKGKKQEERSIKKVADKFVKSESKVPEPTLREKLMGNIQHEDETKEKKEVDKEQNISEEEKVMSKIDFLKDFKKFDPDDKSGKEKQESIEISLTSKK